MTARMSVASRGQVEGAPRKLVVISDGRRRRVSAIDGSLLYLDTDAVVAFRDPGRGLVNLEELFPWFGCSESPTARRLLPAGRGEAAGDALRGDLEGGDQAPA
jgi:hypothetical protein